MFQAFIALEFAVQIPLANVDGKSWQKENSKAFPLVSSFSFDLVVTVRSFKEQNEKNKANEMK